MNENNPLAIGYRPPKSPSEHQWSNRRLSVDAIGSLRALQPREVPWDDKTVKAYADAMKAGDTFPPIKVARVKGALYLVSGFHRLAAAQRARLGTIASQVATMTEPEAVLVALHDNATHGLRLTNADKRRHLQLYCDNMLHYRNDGTVKSTRQIASELFRIVSHMTVKRYLEQRGIEAGEPIDDGLFVKPWEAEPSEESESEMLEDAYQQIHRLRTLCDRLPEPAAIAPIRERLSELISHLDAELLERPSPSPLDI